MQNPEITLFFKEIKKHGYSLNTLEIQPSASKEYSDWKLSFKLPNGVHLKAIEDIIEITSNYWDLNHIDDEILDIEAHYKTNTVNINWRFYC